MITFSGIGDELIASAIVNIIHQVYFNFRYVKLRIYKPSLDIRVAFSTILRISNGDKYLLVRNLHRPETFSPFGGVNKYYENAIPELDNIDFRPQAVGPGKDMKYDLRGYLPRKNLVKLIGWYNKRIEREPYSECLLRELKEEVIEAGLQKNVICPDKMNFRFVRKISEKPKYFKTISCYQYRVFEVYDIYPIQKDCEKMLDKLFALAKNNKNLLLVCQDEIIRGRANGGEIIGPHTHYLLNRKRNRPDDPIFVQTVVEKTQQKPNP